MMPGLREQAAPWVWLAEECLLLNLKKLCGLWKKKGLFHSRSKQNLVITSSD